MNTEFIAAETLLERGVKVKIKAPLLLRMFGKKTLAIRIKQPCFGTLIRISSYYLSAGITEEQLKEIDQEKAMALCAVHGKTFFLILATAILNGYLLGKLFTNPLALYLQWKVKPEALCALTELLVVFSGTRDFMSTIRSVRMMKITQPNLSPMSQGS